MSSNKIVYSDFVDESALKLLFDNLDNIKKITAELKIEAAALALSFTEISKAQKLNAEVLKAANVEKEKAVKVSTQMNEAQKLELSLNKAIEKELALENENIKALSKSLSELKAKRAQNTEAKKANNKESEKAAKIALQEIEHEQLLTKAMQQAARSIHDLQRETSALNKERNKADFGSQKFDELTRKIKQNTDQLKQYDSQVGRMQRNVGNYPTEGLKNIAGGVAMGMGLTTGIGAFSMLIGSGMKEAFTNLNLFNQKLANLRAITGLSIKDTKEMGVSAIDMSVKWGMAASDVVEAYKLVGSAKPELLKNKEGLKLVTDQAILLSKAADIDLNTSVTSLISLMNQFQTPLSQTAKLVDILAAASKAGSAEVADLSNTMQQSAGTARMAKVSMVELASMGETLAEFGKKGENAGVGIRNFLLYLQTVDKELVTKKSLQRLGVDMEKVKNISIPVAERMKELSKITGDATAMAQLFGKENIEVGKILLDNVSKFEEFKVKINENGIATEQAAINMDTLQSTLHKLGASYDAAILKITTGKGGFSLALTSLTKDLKSYIDYLGDALSGQKSLIDGLAVFNPALAVSIQNAIDKENKFKQEKLNEFNKYSLEQTKIQLSKEYELLLKAQQLAIDSKKLGNTINEKEANDDFIYRSGQIDKLKRHEADLLKEQKDAEKMAAEELRKIKEAENNKVEKNEKQSLSKIAEYRDAFIKQQTKDVEKYYKTLEIRQTQQQKDFQEGTNTIFGLNEKLLLSNRSLEEQRKTGIITEKEYNEEVIKVKINYLEDLVTQLEKIALIDGKITGTEADSIIKFKNQIAALKNTDTEPEGFKGRFADALGVKPEELAEIENQVQIFGSSIVSIMDSYYERQNQQLERTISNRQKNIDDLESQIEEAKKLGEEGNANDLQNLETKLKQEKAAQDESIKQQEEIARKQAELGLIVQLSSLATASATLFKEGAISGPYGIAIAIATIASMIAAFAQFKTQISSSVKAEKGMTETIGGQRHSQGGTNLGYIEAEQGEQVSIFNRNATANHKDKIVDFTNMLNSGNDSKFFAKYYKSNPIFVKNSNSNARIEELLKEQTDLMRPKTNNTIMI